MNPTESKFEPDQLSDENQQMPGSTELIEGQAELTLTPEQKLVIDQKRQKLLTDRQFAFRFINSKEYFDLLNQGSTLRLLETNTESIEEIQDAAKQARASKKPGESSDPWEETADQKTYWHTPSFALADESFHFLTFQKLVETARKKGESVELARRKFVTSMKGEVADYVAQIYEKRELGNYRLVEYPQRIDEANFNPVAELLNTPHEILRDQDRTKLHELFLKDPDEFSRSDIRFLMRFTKGARIYRHQKNEPDSKSGGSMVPYEMLEIWSSEKSYDELNPWHLTHGFTSLEKGTSLSELLGIVPISPHDKEFIQEVIQQMIASSQEHPGYTHVVISEKFFEIFPEQGTDFVR